MMPTLTQRRLHELLHYDAATGVFTWRVDHALNRAGAAAGKSGGGSLKIGIDGVRYFAHRLAWLYMTGKLPTNEIDHRNGVSTDNRWNNLRDVDHSVNQQNRRRAQRNNIVGLLGVSPYGTRFRAKIKANGKHLHLGLFESADDAHAAFVTAKRQLHEGCTL